MGTWSVVACMVSLFVIVGLRDYTAVAASASRAEPDGKNFVQEPSFAANFAGPRTLRV